MQFRPYFYLALFFISLPNLLAQNSEWTARLGSAYWDEAADMVLLPSNNHLFVCGMVSDTIQWATNGTLATHGSGDFWVARYDNNGNPLWMQSGGGRVDDRFNALALAPDGNALYTAGTIRDTLVLNGDSLKTEGLYADDPLVVKYNAENGNIIWQKHWKGIGLASAEHIASDAAGNVYVGIEFRDTLYVQSDTLAASGSKDILLIKLNSDGTMQWYKQLGGLGADVLQAMHIDTQNRLYLGGYFQQTAIWGSHILTALGETDIFMAQLNGNGDIVWAKREGGEYAESITSISSVGDNRLYWAGQFSGNTQIDTHNLVCDGISNSLLIASDTLGSVQWLQQGNGAVNTANSLSTDAAGNVYMCGSFSENLYFGNQNLSANGSRVLYVVRHSYNGEAQWIKKIDVSGTSYFSDALALQTDADGKCYIAGNYNGTLLLDNDEVPSMGFSDIMLMRIAQPLVIAVNEVPLDNASLRFTAHYLSQQQSINLQWQSNQSETLQMQVCNLYGQIIHSQTLQGSNDMQSISLTVGELPKGLYIATLYGKNGLKASQKLLLND